MRRLSTHKGSGFEHGHTWSPQRSAAGKSQGPLGAVDCTGRSRPCGMTDTSKLSPLMEPARACGSTPACRANGEAQTQCAQALTQHQPR